MLPSPSLCQYRSGKLTENQPNSSMIFSQISSVISLSKCLHNCRQKASDGNAELRIAQEKKRDQRFLAVSCTYVKFKWQPKGTTSQHGRSWYKSALVLFSPVFFPSPSHPSHILHLLTFICQLLLARPLLDPFQLAKYIEGKKR